MKGEFCSVGVLLYMWLLLVNYHGMVGFELRLRSFRFWNVAGYNTARSGPWALLHVASKGSKTEQEVVLLLFAFLTFSYRAAWIMLMNCAPAQWLCSCEDFVFLVLLTPIEPTYIPYLWSHISIFKVFLQLFVFLKSQSFRLYVSLPLQVDMSVFTQER